MLTRLNLRLRIFLFFCLLACGAGVFAGAALLWSWQRAEGAVPAGPLVSAFVIFAFVNTGLILGVWMLFDEHIAKSINKVAVQLRLRAHANLDGEDLATCARYLGDLAPAADAVSQSMNSSIMETASQVARETQRLKSEHEKLAAILTEIPLATILLNTEQEIVLYDGQAADLLSQIAPPRLKAPMADYFEPAPLVQAIAALSPTRSEARLTLCAEEAGIEWPATVSALGTDGHMLVIDPRNARPADPPDGAIAARPLVFDFDLIDTAQDSPLNEMRLRDICFVVFDTETTGLDVQKDDIIQIGAVRVLNNRMVDGECVDCFVNPGRAVPAASTKVHGISDADIKGAPDIATAGRTLHHFARDAVLVAHNAPFDIGLLRKYQPVMDVAWDHPVLDTVLLSATVFGITETHTLDALCERLSITIPDDLRHTALGDARATAEAFIHLVPLLEAQGLSTLSDVIEAARKHDRLLKDIN